MNILTFGAFDNLNTVHLRFLNYCKSLGSRLIVGVYSDDWIAENKHQIPAIGEDDRFFTLTNIKSVDEVFLFNYQTVKKLKQEYQARVILGSNSRIYFSDQDIEYLPEVYLFDNFKLAQQITQSRSCNEKAGKYFSTLYSKCFISPHSATLLYRTFYALSNIFTDVRYTLSGGSLLGLYRHGGIIPWDDDGDIMYEPLTKEQQTKLSELLFFEFGVCWAGSKSGFAGFSQTRFENSKVNVSRNAVDLFPLQKEGNLWLHPAWPHQAFTEEQLNTTETRSFGHYLISLKVLAEKFVEDYFLRVFGQEWKTHVRDCHSHTMNRAEFIRENKLPTALKTFAPLPEDLSFPDRPTEIWFTPAVSQEYRDLFDQPLKEIETDILAFLTENRLKDGIILIDNFDIRGDYDWFCYSLDLIRGDFPGTQFWIIDGFYLDRLELTFIEDLSRAKLLLSMSPFSHYRRRTLDGDLLELFYS